MNEYLIIHPVYLSLYLIQTRPTGGNRSRMQSVKTGRGDKEQNQVEIPSTRERLTSRGGHTASPRDWRRCLDTRYTQRTTDYCCLRPRASVSAQLQSAPLSVWLESQLQLSPKHWVVKLLYFNFSLIVQIFSQFNGNLYVDPAIEELQRRHFALAFVVISLR